MKNEPVQCSPETAKAKSSREKLMGVKKSGKVAVKTPAKSKAKKRPMTRKEYNKLNPRERVRVDAGYDTIEEAARQLRMSATCLRTIEVHGTNSYDLAERLRRFHGCYMNIWR